MKTVAIWTLVGLGLLLGGCSSVSADQAGGPGLAGMRRFFIVSNPNDNHALDHRIAEALKARGREAEVGPLTMMPDDTQAIVAFQDRWAWDFGDHLVYLQIAVREARASRQPLGSVTFSATVPGSQTVPKIVGRLVDRLLGETKPEAHPKDAPGQAPGH